MAEASCELLLRVNVPNPRRFVGTARSEQLAVRRERYRPDVPLVRVSPATLELELVVEVPEVDHARTSSGDMIAVRRHGNMADALLRFQSVRSLAALHINEAYLIASEYREDVRLLDRWYGTNMQVRAHGPEALPLDFLPLGSVPEPERSVVASRHHQLAIRQEGYCVHCSIMSAQS